MRVLVISAAFPPMPAGEAHHAAHLCQRLAERGVDVHVLTGQDAGGSMHLPFPLYRVIRHWTWRDLGRLARCLRRCAPDAVLLLYSGWLYNHHPMITFAPTIAKALLPRARFVTQFEVEKASIRASLVTRSILKAVTRWIRPRNVDYALGTLFRTSDRIIVLSRRHLLKLLDRFPGMQTRIVMIPPPPLLRLTSEVNGTVRQTGRKRLGVPEGDFLLVYFGYLYPRKGVGILLKALRIVRNTRGSVRLVLVGGTEALTGAAYVEEVQGLIRQLGIENSVLWTGAYAWDSEEASVYLRAGDACVLPFDEGVSLNRSSLAAAAAHGLPIVTTQGEFLAPVFVDGSNVLLCPPQDPESLARAIESLIDDHELRWRLSKGALQLARECFSWDQAIERTLEALGDGGGAGRAGGSSRVGIASLVMNIPGALLSDRIVGSLV